MALKPETNFTNRVLRYLPKSVYRMKNNNPYTAGVADLWFSAKGGDLWIEMKYIDPLPVSVPVRPTKLLSALQLEWLNNRYDEGRNVAVVIGCKTGGVILLDKLWQSDLDVKTFKSLVRPPVELAEWIRGQVEV
jgi:hypothetical protein